MEFRIKRVYDPPDGADGFRVLVDRVWPRGMTKEAVGADSWLKDVAPSTALRKWFGHDCDRWAEFRTRYFAELDDQPEAVRRLLELGAKGRVTLLYSARDEDCNQAAALKAYLLAVSGEGRRGKTT